MCAFEKCQLLLGLDTFSSDEEVKGLCQGDDCLGNGNAFLVAWQAIDK